MNFKFHALDPARFVPLFNQSSRGLAKANAVKKTVDANPGYPCRVSLVDAEVGETVLLLNYQHQPASSPFQAAHAIYVRERAEQAFPRPGAVPELFTNRLISLRAFDDRHWIINADVVEGASLREAIPAILGDPNAAYLHLHNARLGCFLARVTRAAGKLRP